jgi:raffinose/stachyose/melibiose transport system permease protein
MAAVPSADRGVRSLVAAPSIVRRLRAQRWRSRLTVLALALTALAWLLPIVYMVDVSFRLPWDVFEAAIVTSSFTLGNYAQVLADNPLPAYFLNSIIVSGGTTAIVVVGATLFAFAVSILHVRWSRLVYSVVLLTLMVPIAALVVPVTQELKMLGWTNTYAGLIGPYAALGIPFATVILVNVMDDLPEEIHEAAVIDGAGPTRLLRHIVVPMIRPSLVFVAIWQFITSWNEFFLALTVMTRDSVKTLPLIPQQYSGVYLGNPAALFAILTLVAAPLIIGYLLVQRWFVAGLLEGAVKG